jgi:hypothetical protein
MWTNQNYHLLLTLGCMPVHIVTVLNLGWIQLLMVSFFASILTWQLFVHLSDTKAMISLYICLFVYFGVTRASYVTI